MFRITICTLMPKCHWAHLACHGIQGVDSPTESAFILADGKLELEELIKRPLPHAQSACKTATGDLKLAEEAAHLAAGMMLAGYRSVIATMWSIRNGPPLAIRHLISQMDVGETKWSLSALTNECVGGRFPTE